MNQLTKVETPTITEVLKLHPIVRPPIDAVLSTAEAKLFAAVAEEFQVRDQVGCLTILELIRVRRMLMDIEDQHGTDGYVEESPKGGTRPAGWVAVHMYLSNRYLKIINMLAHSYRPKRKEIIEQLKMHAPNDKPFTRGGPTQRFTF